MKINIKKFQAEMEKYLLKPYIDENKRLNFYEGDKDAIEYYRKALEADPEFEAALVLALVEVDDNIREVIEERAAIRWADGLPGDLESAVKCSLQKNQ